ncbi:hypothetical protein GCM10022202_27930 [Microbacterium marinilacus]|uniref:Uncharacterized protein n=1 Tax=Microbacterium marinilacus TaxID=415209 RepID=A0ABP7BQE2_9MICO
MRTQVPQRGAAQIEVRKKFRYQCGWIDYAGPFQFYEKARSHCLRERRPLEQPPVIVEAIVAPIRTLSVDHDDAARAPQLCGWSRSVPHEQEPTDHETLMSSTVLWIHHAATVCKEPAESPGHPKQGERCERVLVTCIAG